MKIKKLKDQGQFIYPATITNAIKDTNFLKEASIPMTQSEINLYLNQNINDISKMIGEAIINLSNI